MGSNTPRPTTAVPSRDGARMEQIIRGVFAGNLFDLGASHSQDIHDGGGMSFANTRCVVQALNSKP